MSHKVYSKFYYKEYETVKFLQSLKYKMSVFFKKKTQTTTENYNKFLQPKQCFL